MRRMIKMSNDDDIICSQCGGELDIGYECNVCGYDMYGEIFGVDFTTNIRLIEDNDDNEFIKDFLHDMIIKDWEDYNY